jgi:gas vesicle protein GvpL/GvpF
VIGVYAIAEGAPAGTRGAQGEALRILRCGALELVVGAAPPPLSAGALREHDAAVRRIADGARACLPARFGSASADDGTLARLLLPREAALLEALSLVRGREQMTLRLHGTAANVAVESGGGPGTRYLEERRRARAVPELDPLRAALGDRIRAERVERHDAGAGLVASAYHLVDRGTARGYLGIVESVALPGVRASASGPWPAWAFAPELEP